VQDKNIHIINNHPLLAYVITSALQSGIYDDLMVSTNSKLYKDIALHYGASVPFMRPEKFASSTSPDIEWLSWTLNKLRDQKMQYDYFSILRPTSPLRSADTIRRAWKQLRSEPQADSLRAVSLCKEHAGKKWSVKEENLTRMQPLLDQDHLDVAWHARQYQDLPKVYIQDSSLEMAKSSVVFKHGTREGRIITPFFSNEFESFAIDYPEDMERLEKWVEQGICALPSISKPPFVFPE
jgi:N-acylneuraminate cytidylyltransferase